MLSLAFWPRRANPQPQGRVGGGLPQNLSNSRGALQFKCFSRFGSELRPLLLSFGRCSYWPPPRETVDICNWIFECPGLLTGTDGCIEGQHLRGKFHAILTGPSQIPSADALPLGVTAASPAAGGGARPHLSKGPGNQRFTRLTFWNLAQNGSRGETQGRSNVVL